MRNDQCIRCQVEIPADSRGRRYCATCRRAVRLERNRQRKQDRRKGSPLLRPYKVGAAAAEDYEPRPARQATRHPPGSADKLRVMRARLERGEELHHPADNPGPAARRSRGRPIVLEFISEPES